MAEEQDIQTELTTRFPYLKDKVRVQRARRVWAEVAPENFAEVFRAAVNDLKFTVYCTVTGLDQGANLSAIYHIARENGIVLNLMTSVPRERPVLQTVTAQFPAAEVSERELVDLLGFQVQGLPEGSRYPLPDDWPQGQYPLRKDWKPEGLPVGPRRKEVAHA